MIQQIIAFYKNIKNKRKGFVKQIPINLISKNRNLQLYDNNTMV